MVVIVVIVVVVRNGYVPPAELRVEKLNSVKAYPL